MSQAKRNNILHICIFDFLFLVISGLVVEYVLRTNKELTEVYIWLSSVLVLLVVISSFVFKEALCAKNYYSYMVLGVFGASIGLMILAKSRPEMPFWIVGAIFTAALVDSGIGLFLGYFLMIQLVNLVETDLVVYFVHVVCLLIVCQKIKKIKTVKDLILTDSIVICINLLVYIAGKVHRLTSMPEDTTIFLIVTYVVVISSIGSLKMLLRKSNKSTLHVNNEPVLATGDNGNGFSYLNEMADELNRREEASKASPASLEDILNAEINDLKVASVEPITNYEAPAGLSPMRESETDYEEFISLHMELLQDLKENNKKSYIQSKRVAALAEECAKHINANQNFAKAIGLFYLAEAQSKDYPDKLRLAIDEVIANTGKTSAANKENKNISSKEAAIVFLTIKVSSLFFYMKASNNASLQPKKLVEGTMSNEMLNGSLNNSGLSLKECTEIRDYFVEKLNTLM